MAGDDIADLMPLIESRWDSVPLGNVTVFVNGDRGKNYPSQSDYVSRGVPFISAADLMDGRVDAGNCTFITEAAFDRLGGGKTKEGDLLFCLRGSLGKVARIRSIPRGAIASSLVIIRATDQADRDYLYYILSGPLGQRFAAELNNGSVQPNISARSLKESCIPLPPLAEQKAIAAVLGALDDKIELNRRMNATLEAMARALFQSWFVDFDPVRAKLDGRPPAALDPATAALFPEHLEESTLGHIPKGWEGAELGQIAHVIDCLHAKKPERCDAGQLYLQLNNIRDDGLIDITDSFFVGAEDYQKWISRMEAVAGDCVITNVGRVGAVGQIPEGVKAALGRNITGIRCKAEFPFPTFLIECLVSESMREEIRLKTDSGTILDALNVKSIPKLRFVRPTREIGARFEELTRPVRRRMEQNISESRTLATLRDTLLPKLLSGELSVTELQN